MSAPRLNRRLILETPERTPDASGGYAVTWQVVGTLWAQITARTGRETAQGDAPISSMSYKIVVRGAPVGDASRPQPDQRFREGTRLFIIQAVAEQDNDGRYLTCFATEETAL